MTLYANKLEVMSKSFTISDLEQIIGLQQESLQALQKALGSLRHQNERLEHSNQKLRKKLLNTSRKVGYTGFEPVTSALSRQRSKPTELIPHYL